MRCEPPPHPSDYVTRYVFIPIPLPAHTHPAGNTGNYSASGTILARHLRRDVARMRAFPGERRMPHPCLGSGVPTGLARRSYLTGPSRDARRRPRQPPQCGIAVVL
jgi:hypothetical protein